MSDSSEAPGLPSHPLLAFDAVADVLLDRVQVGFDLLLPMVPVVKARAFCARLVSRRVLARRPSEDETLGKPLMLGKFLVPLEEGGQGLVTGQIVLASSHGALVLTKRSRLLLNPLRDLRTQLAEPGAKATDGNDNVVWEHGEEWRHLLGWQLANVAAMVDAFFGAVADAAEAEATLLRGQTWIQQCEVCRDHGVADAEGLVREMGARPIPGGVATEVRTVATRQRNLLCVAWAEAANSAPEHKVYAKRRDLLRLEVSLRSRLAVRAMLSRLSRTVPGSADICGTAVAGLLSDVAEATAPLLDHVGEIVDERAAPPPRAGLTFVIGLAPLIRLASLPPRLAGAGGRRPEASLPERARHALDQLLASGSFDARGLGASDAVLLALREMAGEGTLAAPPMGKRLFTLSPGLDAARRGLFDARLPATAPAGNWQAG